MRGEGEEERGLAGEVRTAVRGWDRGREGTLSNLYKNTVATESGGGGGGMSERGALPAN